MQEIVLYFFIQGDVNMLKYEMTDILRAQMLNMRKELNLTSAQMGAIIGKSSSAYNSIENGTSSSITHKLLINMFKAAKLAENGMEYINVETENITVDGLSEFIIRKLDIIINTYTPEVLQGEIWLQSLYLEHHMVKLDQKIFEAIEKMHGTNNWTMIFSSLNKNPSIIRKFIYKEKNLPYVEKRTDEEKQEMLCPFWACLYDLPDEVIEKMADEAIINKRINVAVLYTLFLNHSVKNELGEVNHYNEVAIKFHKNSIPLIFNKLKMVKKPDMGNPASTYLIDLIKFFQKVEIPEEDEGMSMFKKNFLESNIRLINSISFNFSFLTEINDEQCGKLREMIGDTVAEFRKIENV